MKESEPVKLFPGTELDIPERYHSALEELLQQSESAEAAFKAASSYLCAVQKRLWNVLKEARPEVQGFNARYFSDRKVVLLLDRQER